MRGSLSLLRRGPRKGPARWRDLRDRSGICASLRGSARDVRMPDIDDVRSADTPAARGVERLAGNWTEAK